MKILLHLVRADLALFLRGRLALFWTFAFPLLMLMMQMALFGQEAKLGPVTLVVHDMDHSADSAAYARELTRGLRLQNSVVFRLIDPAPGVKPDLELSIPAGFAQAVREGRSTEMKLETALAAGPTLEASYGMLRGFSDAYNLGGLHDAPRVVMPMPPAPAAAIDYKLFLVSGLAGLVILSTSLMGFAAPLVAAREGGMFRLYQLFPMPTGVVVLAWCLSRLVVIVLASAAMFAVAWAVYGVRLGAGASGIAAAGGMLALGCAAFLALGLLLASVSRSVAGVTMLSNLLYFPLLFSGNLMIPLGGLPPLLRDTLEFLPLNAMMASIRRALTGGMSWQGDAYSITILAAMMTACLLLAVRRFGWTPRDQH
ncbi:ABC transporter permease [Pseudoduganella violaceinigra]|uniref:ABC transporter permease n=1 Tax=Pseudoduganella violaceinigra TaxID=246602 RepID=UPI000417A7BD|nr:ABC transporter permease [Pseudoduganella violaceinigra]